MKKVRLYKGRLVVDVYDIEVFRYRQNGWSDEKPDNKPAKRSSKSSQTQKGN